MVFLLRDVVAFDSRGQHELTALGGHNGDEQHIIEDGQQDMQGGHHLT